MTTITYRSWKRQQNITRLILLVAIALLLVPTIAFGSKTSAPRRVLMVTPSLSAFSIAPPSARERPTSPQTTQILPLAAFTDTFSLVPGRLYTLITGSTRQGSGNWGYMDFNGNGGSSSVLTAWLDCGYNPAIRTQAEWAEWCPAYAAQTGATGPTRYWLGEPLPNKGPFFDYSLQAATASPGLWVSGSSGTTNSTCQFFEDIAPTITGRDYLVPMPDRTNGESGGNTRFYIRALYTFHIQSVDVNCHPPRGEEQSWSILGTFLPK